MRLRHDNIRPTSFAPITEVAQLSLISPLMPPGGGCASLEPALSALLPPSKPLAQDRLALAETDPTDCWEGFKQQGVESEPARRRLFHFFTAHFENAF